MKPQPHAVEPSTAGDAMEGVRSVKPSLITISGNARGSRLSRPAACGLFGGSLLVGLVLVGGLAGVGARQPSGRPIYAERELADARLSLLDAEVSLRYWESEIKRCTIEVETWAATTDAEAAIRARLAAFPGMLSKAQNNRQDAALSVARAKQRVDFMEQTNERALTPVVSVPPATGRK